ncbi:hypothetical protein CL620_05065 [archaeon]|jgi:hypothetical protein|nr:hypothetical protein [archaeon]|tara:strand:+ start:377 stop:850 length:474 start_codon:yes stop_codon:yes gene_type:complete
MAIVTGSTALVATGSIPKVRTNIDGSQSVYRLVKLNGRILSAHNRKFAIDDRYLYEDIVLLSGNTKRFIKGVKKDFTLTYQYLPAIPKFTVDGQYGRDYLQELTSMRGILDFFVQDKPNDPGETFSVYIGSYTEDVVRRDHVNKCYYYNVTLKLMES